MIYIYNIGIFLYNFVILIVSVFNNKAKLRKNGAKRTLIRLKSGLPVSEKRIWFHAASLGEFEQGRPIIELLKKKYPELKIVLTFFSPSGYEIRKDYKNADYIFYLPSDTKKNASEFVKIINPIFAVFIKYEFWHWYIKTLEIKKIPLFLISGIFREKQIFFKSYGTFFRNILKKFNHLFVQNQKSLKLLSSININNVSVTGDTRFDRVIEIARKKKEFPLIDKFKGDHLLFIAGSSWADDENIIFRFINKCNNNLKFIIAPHEIHNNNIKRILNLTGKKIVKYSKASDCKLQDYDIMIIDNIGMLSSLYSYADIAYIGGGFGAGIHNTLEAAVFGIPVIFGPKYQKFDEAVELINKKAAFDIKQYSDFENIINKLITEDDYRNLTGENAFKFVDSQKGAADKIMCRIEGKQLF